MSATMLLAKGQYDVSTKPIDVGHPFYKCTRVKDDTSFVARFISLEAYKDLKTVGIEILQSIAHENLLNTVDSFTFDDEQGIFFDGKCEKKVIIYDAYKGMRALLHFYRGYF
jgi:hypothetical protein